MVRDAYGSFRALRSCRSCFRSRHRARRLPVIPTQRRSDSQTIGVAALAFLVAMIAQGKGWSYHSVPARGLLFLALAVELMRFRERPVSYALMAGGRRPLLLPCRRLSESVSYGDEAHIADLPGDVDLRTLGQSVRRVAHGRGARTFVDLPAVQPLAGSGGRKRCSRGTSRLARLDFPRPPAEAASPHTRWENRRTWCPAEPLQITNQEEDRALHLIQQTLPGQAPPVARAEKF